MSLGESESGSEGERESTFRLFLGWVPSRIPRQVLRTEGKYISSVVAVWHAEYSSLLANTERERVHFVCYCENRGTENSRNMASNS